MQAIQEARLFDKFTKKVTNKIENLEEQEECTYGKETKEKEEESRGKKGSLKTKENSESISKSFTQDTTSKENRKKNNDSKKTEKENSNYQALDQIIKNFCAIRSAANLLKEIKDICNKLNILKTVLTHQKKVWDELHDIKSKGNGLLGPAYTINKIKEMDKTVAGIQFSVSRL